MVTRFLIYQLLCDGSINVDRGGRKRNRFKKESQGRRDWLEKGDSLKIFQIFQTKK